MSLRVEAPKGPEDRRALWGREGNASGAELPAGDQGWRVCIFGSTGRGGGVEEAGLVKKEGEEGEPPPP